MPWLQPFPDLRRRLRRSPAASRRRRCAGSLLSRRARRRAQAQGADGEEPRTSQARKRLHHDRDGPLSGCRMPNSRKYTIGRHAIIAIATAVNLAVPILGESGSANGAERKIIAEARFDVTNAPQQAELVQLVVDFPPGAWTSWHTHGGQAINLVLEGEITLRH